VGDDEALSRQDFGRSTRLDKLAGFGGVAGYITVRWDKNFLKVIYLVLARRASAITAACVRRR
jgi:hypothetical protein